MENNPEHGRNEPEFTVSQLSGALKRMVEDAFGAVRLRGEISGYRGPHGSGHAYFSLKDDKARIEAVIWRGIFTKLRLKPEEGMEVIVTGKLTTYPGSSKYQIVIDTLEPAGIGALMALIEERRERLKAEGLFDEARKKPLPFMPKVIGVITSPTGAVIRDILHRIRERFPLHILLWPVRVQGETAAQEAIEAITGFNRLTEDVDSSLPRPDILILARGGGSLEDLWGFNDEALVRAIAVSTIPVISAIGHETDWTLADLVSDKRAPTPTAAAEIAVPVRMEWETALNALSVRLHAAMTRLRTERHKRLASLERALPSLDSVLAFPRQQFDDLEHRLEQALGNSLTRKHALFDERSQRLSPISLIQQLKHLRERLKDRDERTLRALFIALEKKRQNFVNQNRLLNMVNYKNILRRGFVLALDQKGKPIKQASAIREGARLVLRFHDEDREAVVQAATKPDPAPVLSKKSNKNQGQGSLF